MKFTKREKPVNFCCSTCKMDEFLKRLKTFRENICTFPTPHVKNTTMKRKQGDI